MKFILSGSDWMRADANYYPELLAGFTAGAAKLGHRRVEIDLVDVPNATTSADAVAVILTGAEQFAPMEELIGRGIATVAVNRYDGRLPVPIARIDDAAAVETLVGYLARLGHRRIGFLAGPDENLDALDRLDGFLRGVDVNRIVDHWIASAGFFEQTGYRATSEMLGARVRPTAIICASDVTAVGAVHAARDLGISVPVSLSIAGFGDFPMVEPLYPSITTVRQPRFELGEVAADLLCRRIADNSFTGRVDLDAEIIYRESTVRNFLAA